MFIGFHSLANTVTLLGLMSSIVSCFLAANGNFKLALYMLFIACLCDTFDGRIARSNPNRSDKEKFYGIQLDSLCDVISFGVTPCFIAFSFGFRGILDVIVYCIFIACGAVRLAYFNTMANADIGKPVKYFRGLPIPMSTFIITVLFLLTMFISPSVTIWLFRIFLFLTAIAFVLKIRIKKPTPKKALTLIAIELVMLLILLIGADLKAPVNVDNHDVTSEISETTSEEA